MKPTRRMNLLYVLFVCFFPVQGNITCYTCDSAIDNGCFFGPDWATPHSLRITPCNSNNNGHYVPTCRKHVEYLRNNGSMEVRVFRGCSVVEERYVGKCDQHMIDLVNNQFYAWKLCYCKDNLCNRATHKVSQITHTLVILCILGNVLVEYTRK